MVKIRFKDLDIFLSVAKHGSFSRAAVAMSCVQPNVTARIKILEEMCQSRLFHRSNGVYKLTDSGQIFRDYAEKLMNLKDEAICATMEARIPKGALRIAASEALASSRLPVVLAEYHAQFPQVELQVERLSRNIVLERLESGLVDAAVVAGDVDGTQWVTEQIGQESLVLLAPRKADQVMANQAVPVFTVEANCPYAQQLDHWLASKGHHSKKVQIGSIDSVLHCVANNMGIAVLPSSLVNGRPIDDDIAVHTLPNQFSQIPTYLVRRQSNYQSRTLTEFRTMLLAGKLTH